MMAAAPHLCAIARSVRTPLLASLLALALAVSGSPEVSAAPKAQASKSRVKASVKKPGAKKPGAKKSGKASRTRTGTKTAATAAVQARAAAGSPDILLPLSAAYSGSLSCADCNGSRYQLSLNASEGSSIRGDYTLKRQDEGAQAVVVEQGPWRLSYDYGRLILGGGKLPALYAIKDRSTLVQLGIEGRPLDGGQYQMQRQDADGTQPAAVPPTVATVADRLEATFWQLVELHGSAISVVSDPQREPHLVLDGGKKHASGSGGCNRFAGSFERSAGNALRLSGIVSTRIACTEDVRTQRESAFLDALHQTRNYQLQGSRLALLDERGRVLLQMEAVLQ